MPVTRRVVRHQLSVPVPPPAPPWSPASLPNLYAWWDASDAASITASGGAVSQWNDKSGNGHHLTQGTGSFQPSTGTRTQNLLNVIDFDGTTDGMSVATSIASQPLTVLAVVKCDNASNSRFWDSNANRALGTINGGAWAIYAGGSFIGATTTGLTTASRLVGIFNGASSEIHVNGVATTGNAGTGSPNTGFHVGWDGFQTAFLDGFVGELVVMTSVLGAGDETSWDSYVASKWAV